MYRGIKVKFLVTSLFDHFDTVANAIARERGVLAGFLRALYLEHDLVDQSYVVQHKARTWSRHLSLLQIGLARWPTKP